MVMAVTSPPFFLCARRQAPVHAFQTRTWPSSWPETKRSWSESESGTELGEANAIDVGLDFPLDVERNASVMHREAGVFEFPILIPFPIRGHLET